VSVDSIISLGDAPYASMGDKGIGNTSDACILRRIVAS